MSKGNAVLRAGVLAVSAVLAAAGGCQPRADRAGNGQGADGPQMAANERSMYRLRGKVVDAQTLRGLPQARLSLVVRVATPVGMRSARVYGAADSKGNYELRVPLSHETMRQAEEIELSAGLPGYEAKTIEVPRPLVRASFHLAPIVGLRKYTDADLPWQPERDTPVTEIRRSQSEQKDSTWDWLFPWQKKKDEEPVRVPVSPDR